MNSVFIIFGAILVAQLTAAANNVTYRAGVVEFQIRNVSASNIDLNNETLSNARRFVNLMKGDEIRTVDVLVFPEGALNFPATAVPVPRASDNIIACGNNSNNVLIQMISCAAKQSRTYVTVQLYMSVNCTEDQLQWNDTRPCTIPQNNTNIYNAAVVFNRVGAVIAVYRKFNLHNEPNIRQPLHPDNTTFNTDFNVTFGVFICFDILFDAPANHLVKNGIRHFVNPSLWYSELPYLTALQTHQMWSHRHNVNLLVAGANLPSEGITGSGIYSGELGTLAFEYSNTPLTRVLVDDIPRNPGSFDSYKTAAAAEKRDLAVNVKSNDVSSYVLPGLAIWREEMNNFNTRFLNTTNSTEFRDTICINNDNKLCCDYGIGISLSNAPAGSVFYSYAVAVFNGYRTYATGSKQQLHTRTMICSVVACTRYGLHESCGLRFGSNVTVSEPVRFDRLHLKIVIEAGGKGQNGTIVMANTLTRNIHPMAPNEFEFNHGEFTTASKSNDPSPNQFGVITLRLPRNDIQTFALYARNSLQDRKSGSSTIAVSGLLLVLGAFVANYNY